MALMMRQWNESSNRTTVGETSFVLDHIRCSAIIDLSVKELQHALAVIPDMTKLDPDDITDDEILTSTCAGLVRKQPTVEYRNTVSFYSLHRLHSTRIFRTQGRVSIFQMLMPVSL